MNDVSWRSLNPGTVLVIADGAYEFIEITDDDVVVLHQQGGLRRQQSLTIAEARQLKDVSIVPPPEPAQVFHDDDLLRLDHLSAKDFDLTMQRMALIEAAKEYERTNPATTAKEIANYARGVAYDRFWAERFVHKRKSGLKSLKDRFSLRTAEHYILQYQRFGLDGIVSKESSRGSTTISPRTDPVFVALATRAMDEWRDGRLLTKFEAWKHFLGLVKKEFNGNEKPPGVISRRTFERWIDDLPRRDVIASRNGEKAASDTLDRRDVRPVPARAFDEVEIDCKIFDAEVTADSLFQFAATGDSKKSRPFLVAAIDRKTGYLPAYRLFLGTPSSLAVQQTLVEAFVDRSAWRVICGLPASNGVRREGFGTLRTDGGNEFVAHESRACYAKLNMNFQNGAARTPHHRGKIEDLNAIISTFTCWLPGQVGKDAKDRKARAEVFGNLSLDELNRWFTIWAENVYHQEVSWGSHGLTRVEAVIQDQNSRALRAIPSEELLGRAVTVSGQVIASRYGLRFENHLFHSDAVAHFVQRHGKRRVEIRLYANDIGSIDALLDETWVSVPNLDQHYVGVTLPEWRLANAAFVARGKKVGSASNPIVIETTMRIQRFMREKMDKEGRAPSVNCMGDVLRFIDDAYDEETGPDDRPSPNHPGTARTGIDLTDYTP